MRGAGVRQEEASLGAFLFSARCKVIDVALPLEEPSVQDMEPSFKANFSRGRFPSPRPAYRGALAHKRH